jgi:hypothetical protein
MFSPFRSEKHLIDHLLFKFPGVNSFDELPHSRWVIRDLARLSVPDTMYFRNVNSVAVHKSLPPPFAILFSHLFRCHPVTSSSAHMSS